MSTRAVDNSTPHHTRQFAPAPTQPPIAARRHPLIHQIETNLTRRCGIDLTRPVVLGVSGGADSIALLIACTIIARRNNSADPIIVHVNHHLRPDADADAAFVKHLAHQLGLPFECKHIEPARHAGNTYAIARELRYDALRQAATAHDARAVLVAHHADDQFETLLMHLCRGSGAAGLSGMPWTRDLDDTVQLARPLLDVRRSDCEALCHAAAVHWLDDPANDDRTRNRAHLRHAIIPALEQRWPDAPARSASAADLIRIALQALDDKLDASFADQTTWQRTHLRGHDPVLIAAGLRRAALAIADDPDSLADQLTYHHALEAALAITDDEKHPRRFSWPRGLTLHITSREVHLQPSTPSAHLKIDPPDCILE